MSKGIDKYIKKFEDKFRIENKCEQDVLRREPVNETPTNKISLLKKKFCNTGDIKFLKEAYKVHLLEYEVDDSEISWDEISSSGSKTTITDSNGRSIPGFVIDGVFYYKGKGGKTLAFRHPHLHKIKTNKKYSNNVTGSTNVEKDKKPNIDHEWRVAAKLGKPGSVTGRRGNKYTGFSYKDNFYYKQQGKVFKVPVDGLDIGEDCAPAGVGTAEVRSPSKVKGEFPKRVKEKCPKAKNKKKDEEDEEDYESVVALSKWLKDKGA